MAMHLTRVCDVCGADVRISVDEIDERCACGRIVWSADDAADWMRMEEEEDRWFFLRRLSEETGFDVSEIELHSDVLLDYQLDHDFYVNYTIEGRNGATETPLTLITVPVDVHEVNECETPGLTTFAAAVGW